MIQKTMQPKDKRKFDMPTVRRRARRLVKKRYGKRIKLTKVDKIWKEFVKYGIVRELLKYGKVQIDKNFSMEIVGRNITEDKKLFKIFVRGIGVRNGIITNSANLNKGRDGYVYHIVLTDNNFKEGVLIYKPTDKIREAVHNSLVNTNTYYRIATA